MTAAVAEADNYTQWILEELSAFIGKRALEVGAGYGNLKKFIRNAETYVSVDISEEAIARAREKDPDGAYVVADISEDSLSQRLSGQTFDSVICLNVLEHIENDAATVARLAALLAPGGTLLLLAPAFEMLYNDLDRLAGHHRRYNARGARILAEAAGLTVLKLDYFNPVGGSGWLVNSLFTHNDLNSKTMNQQVRLFDRYLVPISKALNPLTRKFFGQSLIMVGQK
jgi:SAM-dependent methyltransferase